MHTGLPSYRSLSKKGEARFLGVTENNFRYELESRISAEASARKDEFAKLAAWGVRTHIANR